MQTAALCNIILTLLLINETQAITFTPTPTPTAEPPARPFRLSPDLPPPNSAFRFTITHPRDRAWGDSDRIGFALQSILPGAPVPGRVSPQFGYWRVNTFDCSDSNVISVLEIRSGVSTSGRKTVTWQNVQLPPGQYAVCYTSAGQWFDAHALYYSVVVRGPHTYSVSPDPLTVNTTWSLVVFGVSLGIGDKLRLVQGVDLCTGNVASKPEALPTATVSKVNSTSDATVLRFDALPVQQAGSQITLCYSYGATGWYKLDPVLTVVEQATTSTVTDPDDDPFGGGLWWKIALLVLCIFLIGICCFLCCCWFFTRKKSQEQQLTKEQLLEQAELTRSTYGDGTPFDPVLATGAVQNYEVMYYHARLKITVVEAKDLPSTSAIDKNDLFIEVMLSRNQGQHRTQTQKNSGTSAVWNESFETDWNPKREFILITAYNEDVASAQKIGHALVRPTAFLMGSRGCERWLPLMGTKYGQVKLRMDVIGGHAVRTDGTHIDFDPNVRRDQGVVPIKDYSGIDRADDATNTSNPKMNVARDPVTPPDGNRDMVAPLLEQRNPLDSSSAPGKHHDKRDSGTVPSHIDHRDEATNVHMDEPETLFGVPVASMDDPSKRLPFEDEPIREVTPPHQSEQWASHHKAQRTSHWFEKHAQFEQKYPNLAKSLDSTDEGVVGPDAVTPIRSKHRH